MQWLHTAIFVVPAKLWVLQTDFILKSCNSISPFYGEVGLLKVLFNVAEKVLVNAGSQ